jgi:hypothetical protein
LTCVVEEHLWREIEEETGGGGRIIAEISRGERRAFCALGSPVRRQTGDSEGRVYAPLSILEQLGLYGTGEEVTVAWRNEEAFPEATRLILKPRDEAFYGTDVKEELEFALTRIGVLQLGDVIRVPLKSLGGYEVVFDVLLTEPASVVLMQGDEVAIEFDQVIPAPLAAPITEEPFDVGPMVPVAAAGGNVLGGRLDASGRPWNPWREYKP